MNINSWKISDNLYRDTLPGNHELIFNPESAISVAVLNVQAQRTLNSFRKPRTLKDNTDQQLASLGLLNPFPAEASKLKWSAPETLTAWLHVTNTCNLRCPYCYVQKTQRSMDVEIGIAAVDAVFRSAQRHNFRAVKLKYAGGEPTLNWPLILTLHAHAQKLAASRELQLHATVLSNGTTLTHEMIDWLREEHVRLMISLDGIGAIHDAQRPFADGSGSFSKVAHSIACALDHGLSPYLSITVTPQNADHLPEVVAFALERNLQFNLNFVRDPERSPDTWRIDAAHLIKGMRAAFKVIETALPPYRLVDALLDRTLLSPHRYPCGAGHNYLVIDTQGRIARCQMELDTPVTDIQAHDPLQSVQDWDKGFQNISVDEKPGCQACPWRYWCAGGCPLLAHRTTRSGHFSSPYCAVYKALFPQLLRLEGLRLLKYAS